jgi:hypothetical protein
MKLLGFPERDGGEDIYKTPVYAEWKLTDTAIERIEELHRPAAAHRREPGDLKASISASREAVELLRGMRPATVNSSAQRRDLAEREAVILDKMKDLPQALFAYDSAASHTDSHLRDIAWNRESAVLALGTAVSLAPAHLLPHLTCSQKADADGVLVTTVTPDLH